MKEVPLVGARMVNEFVYCPRLAYLMWSQVEWSETGDTVDGRDVHRRTDKSQTPLPPPEALDQDEDGRKIISRSLTLSSEKLGIIAKLDVAEAQNGLVTPIDYKRGKRPHVAQGAYEPERIQVCLQALLLEEHGYRVEEGMIYYAGSRERVYVVLDEALRTEAQRAISELRLLMSQGHIPPPLKDSPKCPRCALVGICLPDEVHALGGSSLAPRPMAVPADYALPLVIQSQFARVSKDGETLKISDEKQGETRARFIDISDVALFGNIQISTSALMALIERDIPVSFHSYNGWFRGMAHGLGHRNIEVRVAQYHLNFNAASCLHFARDLVAAKITNQRTMLRRNWRGTAQEREHVLNHLKTLRRSTTKATDVSALLGVEGAAAATYFRAFSELFKQVEAGDRTFPFRFDARNRRPPTDPVNAMLSLAYAMLSRHLTIMLASVGLDPYLGFYHAPRYGRPALALDIMEPFRPIIADSVVLSVINNGELRPSDFLVTAAGAALTSEARRRFVMAFERRLSQETTHPSFGYQVSMRRMLMLQARLLTRFLLGELRSYPHYLPR